MSTHYRTDLEIDHERGVIYVHLMRSADLMNIGAATVLRIQGLPRPIPQLGPGEDQRTLLDINLQGFDGQDYDVHVNWEAEKKPINHQFMLGPGRLCCYYEGGTPGESWAYCRREEKEHKS